MISFYILSSLVCGHFGEVFDSPIELGAEGCEDLDFSFHKLLVKGGQRLESYWLNLPTLHCTVYIQLKLREHLIKRFIWNSES